MEIIATYASGVNLKTTIENADGNFYVPASGVFMSNPAFVHSASALTEGTGEYAGKYSVDITSSGFDDGTYKYYIHNADDNNIALTAGSIVLVNGVKASTMPVYHADIQVVIGSSQDKYIVTWFENGNIITSGITLPKLTVIDEDGTNLFANANMTAQTGYFVLETSTRMTAGNIYHVKANCTYKSQSREFSWNLGRDS